MFIIWLLFLVLIIGLLVLDLGVLNRNPHVISAKESFAWTAFWVVLALVFNVLIFYMYEHHWLGIGQTIGHEISGKAAAIHFFTGYLIEKSLSLDNIFVIALIFSYFGIPLQYQHRVLFWGILGALVMRGTMIGAGVILITKFSWMVYVFGALLLFTAVKILIQKHDNIEPGRNPLVKLIQRYLPVTTELHGQRFFLRQEGKLVLTPLCIVLVIIESADLLFAIDSIPAIFAITYDPFIIFTSNVFAILGLRSLYFALAAVIEKFRYLKISLVFILAFVGVKILLSHHHPIPATVSLGVIAGIIFVGILASILGARCDTAAYVSPLMDDIEEIAELTWRQARRVAVIVIGSTVLLIGLIMLITPGPAFVVIPLGLAILGTEVIWARKILKRMKDKVSNSVREEEHETKDVD